MSESQHDKLLNNIRKLLTQGRQQAVTAVNAAMVQTYWEMGRLIVEDEQQGKRRAAYGKKVLKKLSESLSCEFGKGFDLTNLRNMRAFYLCFPKRDALRLEWSWTHYRALIRIENEQARLWYMKEAAEQSWSTRALERQMGTLYYERLLATQHGKLVDSGFTLGDQLRIKLAITIPRRIDLKFAEVALEGFLAVAITAVAGITAFR